jgi:hypothetical protein
LVILEDGATAAHDLKVLVAEMGMLLVPGRMLPDVFADDEYRKPSTASAPALLNRVRNYEIKQATASYNMDCHASHHRRDFTGADRLWSCPMKRLTN